MRVPKGLATVADFVSPATPAALEATVKDWNISFQADIMGLVTLIETAKPHLVERARNGGQPSVVVISSLAGFEARHQPIAGPYSTFKRAQAVLAKDYSRTLAPLGIRINTIAPGAIETQDITWPDGTVNESTFQRAKKEHPGMIEGFVDTVPLNRAGTPEEIANTVLFLSSPLASYICGSNIVVDGGLSIGF